MEWLSTNSVPTHNYINDFLNNLDTFDLNQYIKAIHFDEMKVPFVPFYKQVSKNYYGIEEMKKGELDFLRLLFFPNLQNLFLCAVICLWKIWQKMLSLAKNGCLLLL